jgi:hypothetical protein
LALLGILAMQENVEFIWRSTFKEALPDVKALNPINS